MTLALSALRKIKPYIRHFDVSMRDGLQSIPRIYTLPEKKIILNNIMKQYNPHALEIGSLVSSKLLPQMNNSYELYNYANTIYNKTCMYNTYSKRNIFCNAKIDNHNNINNNCDFYLLVPPTKKYLDIAKKLNIRNVSLTTSITDTFQKKNINQSIKETKKNIKEVLKTPGTFDNVKLYVSCITNCPLTGPQDNEYIVNELYEYLNIDGINEVCISDTCGNMKFGNFKHIIDYLSIEMNYNLEKISLHLHINANDDKKDCSNINNIIEYAIENNIYKFDVTSMENIGGCSITINDKSKLNSNLTYDRLYESLY
jgi:isopropylmalate/homocitrate/citramalate synthase